MVINPSVFVFAIFRRIVAANGRPGFVNAAKVVVAQLFARGMHQQKPIPILRENRCPIVKQKPTNELEIPPSLWRFDGQGEIAAAFRRAIAAKHFAGLQILAMYFLPGDNER
jgi:hypothetical protein